MPNDASGVLFPIQGIDLSSPQNEQKPTTTAEAVNVQVHDPCCSHGRRRGGRREGLARLNGQIPEGRKMVQHINMIVLGNPQTFYGDDYPPPQYWTPDLIWNGPPGWNLGSGPGGISGYLYPDGGSIQPPPFVFISGPDIRCIEVAGGEYLRDECDDFSFANPVMSLGMPCPNNLGDEGCGRGIWALGVHPMHRPATHHEQSAGFSPNADQGIYPVRTSRFHVTRTVGDLDNIRYFPCYYDGRIVVLPRTKMHFFIGVYTIRFSGGSMHGLTPAFNVSGCFPYGTSVLPNFVGLPNPVTVTHNGPTSCTQFANLWPAMKNFFDFLQSLHLTWDNFTVIGDTVTYPPLRVCTPCGEGDPSHHQSGIGQSYTETGEGTAETNPLPNEEDKEEEVKADFNNYEADMGQPIVVGQPTTFLDNSSPQSMIRLWVWDFGDGQQTVSDAPDPVQHVYMLPGTYSPTLVVTGVSGQDAKTRPGYITVVEE